ncbi:nitroreductase [Bradyrhizobium sp.]|uniref:nitroreductase family protein n=1 Tax=Bradyrhizobium sp. TaxID=376 RepID=UPI002733CAD6|nr:nitroreductase [Bradyrhizobium sp.]MDP3690570.1 nitroreductase [Bradyrhizobium sp.]
MSDRITTDMPVSLAALLGRHSLGPRWMVAPGPDAQELALAVQAALRAPNHGRLQPWRLVTIAEAQRPALAALFEQFARDAGKSEEEVATERERAWNGPVLVAWVARIDASVEKVPPHEQWICVGAAMGNFMNALHSLGYGAKILSGRKCQHPALVQAFCEEGEQLVGFTCIGTPTRGLEPREKDEAASLVSAWKPG